MKKLILLLLVLMGFVCEAGAAWYDVYLHCGDNSWGVGSASYTTQLTKKTDDHYYLILNSSDLGWTDGKYYFRFRASGEESKWYNINAYTNNDIPTSAGYDAILNESGASGGNTFMIENDNVTTKYLINLDYYDSKWHLHVFKNKTYSVALVKNDDWGTPKAYIWTYNYDCASWPGITLTNNDGGASKIYTATGIEGFENAEVIFTDKTDGSNELTKVNIVNNAVYEAGEGGATVVSNQSISITGTNEYSTYTSDYPLTFPSGDDVNIKAYQITGTEGGTVSISRVTGVVPAKTGLLLERKDADNNSISAVPAAVSTVDVTSNLLKPGTGTKVTQTEGTGAGMKTNYVLTTNTANSNVEQPMKFYKVNSAGNTVPAGKAYLQLSTPDGSSAPEFVWFDDSATSISVASLMNKEGMNNEVYNLNGQRVSQPTRGLYIVGGRKVAVK